MQAWQTANTLKNFLTVQKVSFGVEATTSWELSAWLYEVYQRDMGISAVVSFSKISHPVSYSEGMPFLLDELCIAVNFALFRNIFVIIHLLVFYLSLLTCLITKANI